jgi:hypothetical protein
LRRLKAALILRRLRHRSSDALIRIERFAAVTKYIAKQEEHHKKHSFQEEFLTFLKKNDVAYDERYIWG